MTVVERAIDFAIPAERLWAVIGDVPAAAACLPGLAIGKALPNGGYSAQITIAVGLLSLRYAGRLTAGEVDSEARRVDFRVEGTAFGGLTLAVRIAAEVRPCGAAASRLSIVNEIGLDAATTLMAGPMIGPVGTQLLTGFERNIRRLTQAAAAGAPPAR